MLINIEVNESSICASVRLSVCLFMRFEWSFLWRNVRRMRVRRFLDIYCAILSLAVQHLMSQVGCADAKVAIAWKSVVKWWKWAVDVFVSFWGLGVFEFSMLCDEGKVFLSLSIENCFLLMAKSYIYIIFNDCCFDWIFSIVIIWIFLLYKNWKFIWICIYNIFVIDKLVSLQIEAFDSICLKYLICIYLYEFTFRESTSTGKCTYVSEQIVFPRYIRLAIYTH